MKRVVLLVFLSFVVYVSESCRKDDDTILVEVPTNIDSDGDGIIDADDNCPNHPSTNQFDSDYDGIGDVCDTDFEARFAGAIPETAEDLANVDLVNFIVKQNLPSEMDVTAFPPCAEQGFSASSVAFSVAYNLKHALEVFEREWNPFDWIGPIPDDYFPNFDMSGVFSPAFIYNQINEQGCTIEEIYTGSCGAKLIDALEILKTQGVCTWSSMPYLPEDSTTPNNQQREEAIQFEIAEYLRIDHTNLQQVKIALSHKLPIVFTMAIDSSFINLKDVSGGNDSLVWNGFEGDMIAYHSMIIGGYNDALQAVLIRNSWGRNWGKDYKRSECGGAWIKYTDFMQYTHSAFIAIDKILPEYIEYDEYLYGDWDGDGKANIAYMDVYPHFDLDFDQSIEYSIFSVSENEHLVGDWDKDGIDELATRYGTEIRKDFYGDQSTWFEIDFGLETDIYIVGDWDGDIDDNIGVKRGNEFLLNTNADSEAEITFTYGEESDKVIVGDFNGDGIDNIALLRDDKIIIDFEYDGIPEIEFTFGSGNQATEYFSEDWNGDGIDDIAYRETYFISIDTNFDGIADLHHFFKGYSY